MGLPPALVCMDRQRTVLFICHANTCRSVIASELLKHFLQQRALHGLWQVRSGGIAPYARDGALVSLDARLVLREEGIELARDACSTDLKRNRHLLTEADLILAMTAEQIRMLREYFPEAQGKPAFTLKEFAGESGDVEDPFGQPERAYALCKDEIKRCLLRIVDRWAGEIGGTQWVRSS